MFGVLVFINLLSVVVMLLGLVIAFGNQQWASPLHMWLTIGATIVAVISSTLANVFA